MRFLRCSFPSFGDILAIRYEGPKGGPSMQEVLNLTSALIGQGLGDSVDLNADGCFFGGNWVMRRMSR